MTTTTTVSRSTTVRTPGHAGLANAIQSEWTKLRSLRSTRWMLILTVAGSALITFFATRSSTGHAKAWYVGFDPTNQSFAGLFFAALVLGVWGALAVTGEYGTGTMRSSLCAVPRRGSFYLAKALVVGVLALAAGEILSFMTFFEGQAIFARGGAPSAALSQPGVLRAVLFSGAFLMLLALFAFGVGSALRHTAGALAVYVGCTFLAGVILQRLSEEVARFGPVIIFVGSVGAVVPQHGMLSATSGFLMMGIYTSVALTAGAIVLLWRDA